MIEFLKNIYILFSFPFSSTEHWSMSSSHKALLSNVYQLNTIKVLDIHSVTLFKKSYE